MTLTDQLLNREIKMLFDQALAESIWLNLEARVYDEFTCQEYITNETSVG